MIKAGLWCVHFCSTASSSQKSANSRHPAIQLQGCTKNTWRALQKIAGHKVWWRAECCEQWKGPAAWSLNLLALFSQVSFTASMHPQSFTVEVCVIDKNDNVPVFLEESMRGSVQLGLLKGGRQGLNDTSTKPKEQWFTPRPGIYPIECMNIITASIEWCNKLRHAFVSKALKSLSLNDGSCNPLSFIWWMLSKRD